MKTLNKLFLALTTVAALSMSSFAVAGDKSGVDTDVKPMDRIECKKTDGVWGCIIYPY